MLSRYRKAAIRMTLEDKFCAHFNCSREQFAGRALRLFLHQPWAWASPIILKLRPQVLATDLQIVRQLGLVSSGTNLTVEIRDIRTDYLRQRDYGFLRRALRLRLSRARIARVCKTLF